MSASFGSSEARDAWVRAAEERGRMMAAVTARMFALASVVEGARILDVGTGTGDASPICFPISSSRFVEGA
jgi:protein-L-isoaspartate O-methyltransferase